jgi:galactonate dehydratase
VQEVCLLDEAVLRSDVPWRDEVCVPPFPTRDGQRWPSDQAGLGVDVGDVAAADHPWQPEDVLRWWQPDGSVADW